MGFWELFDEVQRRRSRKTESQDPAVSAALSRSGVPGAAEWGAVAGRRRAAVVDAAGDGTEQVAGEDRPGQRWLNWIPLTSILEQVGRAQTRSYSPGSSDELWPQGKAGREVVAEAEQGSGHACGQQSDEHQQGEDGREEDAEAAANVQGDKIEPGRPVSPPQ